MTAKREQMHIYNEKFYDDQSSGSLRSAKAIVPTIVDLLSPKSVVDIGSGIGTWLSVFVENGVQDILGIDGPYVERNKLLIPSDCFLAADLNNIPPMTRPFDLALCLEVAEHLPHNSSDTLVDALTTSSNVVLFSAAIPFQGGEFHINEQWPDYWHEKFIRKNFISFDFLRQSLWANDEIEFWYRQNMVLYVRADHMKLFSGLPTASNAAPPPLVHPQQYLQKCAAITQLEQTTQDQVNLISQLRDRIEALKDPSQHSPWGSFVFFVNTLLKK